MACRYRGSTCVMSLPGVLLVIYVSLLCHALATTDIVRERDLVGWQGETYTADRTSPATHGVSPSEDAGMVVALWEPRVFLYKDFLTAKECEELIQLAESLSSKSGVDGKDAISKGLHANGTSIPHGENEMVKHINDRVSRLTMTAISQGDEIQVLMHDEGKRYKPLHDYSSQEEPTDFTRTKLLTGIMFLSDVEEGGEVIFPKVKASSHQQPAAGYSACASKSLAFKPRKGDLLLFWHLRNDGRPEPKAVHETCPVLKGHKWFAIKSVHVLPYRRKNEPAAA